MSHTQTASTTNSRIGAMLNNLNFFTPEDLDGMRNPKLMEVRYIGDGGRPFERLRFGVKPGGLELKKDPSSPAGFLLIERPEHPYDALIMPRPVKPYNPLRNSEGTASGYLSMPEQALYPLDKFEFKGNGDLPATGPMAELPEFDIGTPEELMEEYMQTQAEPTVADVEVVDVIQIEDERAHQLITTPDPVQRAVVLLRLLEEDVYMMERVGGIDPLSLSTDLLSREPRHAKSVLNRGQHDINRLMKERNISYVEAKFDNKLNALAHTGHIMLMMQLHRIRDEDRIDDLMEALTRLEYTHWIDLDTGHLHLRHKAHNKYGSIIV